MKYERFFIIFILALIIVLSHCSKTHAQPSSVYIDQVGSSNEIVVNQDGTGHLAAVSIGTTLPTNTADLTTGYGIGTFTGTASDYNYVGIRQQGPGYKTATVEIPNGNYNFVTVFQDGTGNHTSAIQNLTGNNNNIGIVQTGSGNHSLTVSATSNTTNSNNTISATQSGAGDKSFALTLDGTNGATVTVQQTNPTQANTGSMTIQCTTCGSYSYIRQ